MKMPFKEYMDRYWKGYTPKKREFVEDDELYQIHCKMADTDSACARAEAILLNPQLKKKIVTERVLRELDSD